MELLNLHGKAAACLCALPKGGVRAVQASGGCPGFHATVQSEGTHTGEEVQSMCHRQGGLSKVCIPWKRPLQWHCSSS